VATLVGYKFLRHGAVGAISGFVWPRSEWIGVEGPLEQCRRGVHVMRLCDLAYWLDDELWRIEYSGEERVGLDCLLVPRTRLVERVAAWSDGGADRFALAARDHLVELSRQAPAEKREMIEGIISDASAHLPRRSTALAAYCSAIGIARLGHDESAAYRRERAWQSDWIARDLSLDD
jgi:hypothetical protein